ncbi:MAG: hypothetical protein EXS09_04455 [Gemmataceae bacterium]|nr:hypothetical protein [Gemmataceae bacterium]
MLLRHPAPGQRSAASRRGGFVIVAVLMVVTVLSLAAYQYSALMDAEVLAAERIRKTTEVKALADSGLYHAMAHVTDPDAFEGVLSNNPFDNPGKFQDVIVNEGESARAQGRFSLVALDYGQDPAAGSIPLRYGMMDEAARLNLNALFALDSSGKVLHDALMKLPSMTDEVAWSIVDWVDPNDEPSAGGAENEYYTARSPSYLCKNAPLDTVEELLLVKGVTPSLLFGTDRNRNGKLDPGEDDGMGYTPGWAAFLTVYSRERNVDVEGMPRINLNGNDMNQLKNDLVAVVGEELTTFILAYRLLGPGTAAKGGSAATATLNMGTGKLTIVTITSPTVEGSIAQLATLVQDAITKKQQPKQRISSLFALVSATVNVEQAGKAPTGGKGGPAPTTTISFKSPLANKTTQVDLLGKMLDKTTTQQGAELPAKVNVNTAPRAVLLTLPGITETDADSIQAKRPQYLDGESPDAKFATIAWLLGDNTLTVAKMQALERYLTARTQVYRVQSIGYFDEAGPMARVEAVIDTNQGKPRIVYYRDLTDLGRSIDPRTLNR